MWAVKTWFLQPFYWRCDIKMRKKSITLIILATAILSSVLSWNARGIYDIFDNKDIYSKLHNIQNVLDKEFLYDYDKDKAADYAALGLTMALEDPYTVYYTKKQFEEYTNIGSGDFIGIGVTVVWNKDNNTIEVISVMENSPGMEAGILPGDIIVAVNDQAYTGTTMNDAVSAIRGTNLGGEIENTTVNVTVERKGKEIDLTLTRKKIHENTVSYENMKDGIGYMRITAFNRESQSGESSTFDEFKQAYLSLLDKGMTRLIIDLRDNGGGDLNAVAGIIDSIIPEGILMYSIDKSGHRHELTSDKYELNIPIVLLVNGNSASAAELMTGALKDYNKATIIGTKTFGKGVMQSVFGFPDGSGMTVTIAKYYTPKGICVHEDGITPDIEIKPLKQYEDTPVSLIDKKDDVQLQAAINHLMGK